MNWERIIETESRDTELSLRWDRIIDHEIRTKINETESKRQRIKNVRNETESKLLTMRPN